MQTFALRPLCFALRTPVTVATKSKLLLAGPSVAAFGSVARPSVRLYATVPPSQGSATGSGDAEDNVFEDNEDLLEEEDDWVVPGGPSDSLSPNTPLGKAIRSACDELEHLNKMEMESLTQAQSLLAKLGYKGDIFQGKPPVLEKDTLDLENLGEDAI